MIMQFRPWALTAPLYWLLPHLTPDIHVADQLVHPCSHACQACFKKT